MAKSTRNPSTRKAATASTDGPPPKPYPEFPLSPHTLGYWQKKIRGKVHFFGRWGRKVNGVVIRIRPDGCWQEALEEYKVQADDLHAGRTPRPKTDELTVADLCNQFLTAKLRKLDSGELGERMFAEYRTTTDRLVAEFGKNRRVADLGANDFESLRSGLAKQFGPVRVGNEVQKARTLFKYAFDAGLIDRPMRFGGEFKKPSKRTMRKHRAASGKRTFRADELRKLIEAAGVQLRAMILLGANAAFGNADCGQLPLTAVDLDAGWVVFPRPKTGIPRRCPLWPETVEALRTALADRPNPKGDAAQGLMFVTKYGGPWAMKGSATAVTHEVGKLLIKTNLARPGLGFYALRHTFRTVADGTKDPNAIRLIMGHTDDRIDDNYTHGIEDARLLTVSNHVRAWLFVTDAQGV